jgi:hypothetical protein
MDSARTHVRRRSSLSLQASAWIHGLAFEHDRAIAADRGNAERGKVVVLARNQEPVWGCRQEAERERFLLLAGEQ